MKSLEGCMELSNNRILELIIENSLLVNELSSHKVGIGSMVNEHQDSGLQDDEVGIQAVFNSEEHLRGELIRMSANLQEYVEATQCLKMEMEDSSWKPEFENGLTIESLKEKVVNLIEDINLLGDNLTSNQRNTIAFDDRMPQRSYMALISLHSSKVELEGKLNKCSALTKDFEQKTEEKDEVLDNEVQMFRQTENGISHLKGKSTKKEFHLLNCKNDSEERISHEESMKEQRKVLKKNVVMLKKAKDRISFLEQEVAMKEGLLERSRIEEEERSWRFEFEEDLLSMYINHSFQEFLKHRDEIQGNLFDVGSIPVSDQNELEVAQPELRKWKAKADALKSEELKLNHQEILSLCSEVEEQNDRLTCHLSDISDLETALETRDHDLLAFTQGADSASALQQIALVEMDGLKKGKHTLAARIEEEKQRVQKLQEALAEQSWKNEVELEIFMTVVWEGKAYVSVDIWNEETGETPLGEARIREVLEGQKPSIDKEASKHTSLEHGHDGWIVQCPPVLVQLGVTKSEAPDTKKMPTKDQDLVNYQFQQCSTLSPNETEHLQNIQNLQKAETEVDMLGDEVEVLMTILEKVYGVLNHYVPIIQHYPGLAELVKVLRQEILWRICPSNEG